MDLPKGKQNIEKLDEFQLAIMGINLELTPNNINLRRLRGLYLLIVKKDPALLSLIDSRMDAFDEKKKELVEWLKLYFENGRK